MFVRRLSEPSAENASMMAQIINILVGYVFVPVGTFMAFLLLMLKRSRKFQEVFSACVFFPLVSPFFKSAFEGIRREVMRNLDDVVSCDPVLRESNAIRVLEVGVGTGRNFEYINRNVKFLAVDPNSAFKDRFLENQANYSHIELEEWVLTRGEDMKQLPDNFVDAVIITHVLCSVVDARKVLSECRRVLTPGGKMLFMEHIACPEDTWTFTLQTLVDPLWQLLTCGCHLNRSTSDILIDAGFPDMSLKEVYLPILVLLSRHVYGVATKSRS